MKNKNECFFSISLENGITITGANPKIVVDYLTDMYVASIDCEKTSIKQGHKQYARIMQKYREEYINARMTILNNTTTK